MWGIGIEFAVKARAIYSTWAKQPRPAGMARVIFAVCVSPCAMMRMYSLSYAFAYLYDA